MKLQEIKLKFEKGEISKQDFIDKMYSIHENLLDYASFLADTVVNKIEISDGEIVMSSKSVDGKQDILLGCVANDKRTTTFEMLNFGSYEWEDCESLFEFVENNQTIFDIGANIGWYSLNFANGKEKNIVYSFEPIPATFQNLEKNISRNPFKNIKSNNIALSNSIGELEFFFNPDELGASSSKNIKEMESIQRVVCKMTTLDQFVEDNNIAALDLIKCDVEGAELLVFQGAVKSIEKFKPIIFTEMLRKWSAKFNYHPNDIISLFAGLGYKCFTASGKKITQILDVTENTNETNFFFLHPEKHKDQISKSN